MKFMLRCLEASELLSQRQDGELHLADSARLRLHLAMCGACRNVGQQLELIRRAVRQLSEEQSAKP